VNTNDQAIAEFLKERSASHFSVLYDTHTPSLIRTALYLARNDRMKADDLVQETWITAVEQIAQFRQESSLKTWLTGILINKFRQSLRYGKTTDDLEEVRHHADSNIDHDLSMDLREVLMRLPDGYKEILLLHDMEGFKHREIAGILSINEGTSKSQLFEARKAMRLMLQGYYP